MKTDMNATLLFCLVSSATALAEVSFTSPGFAPSRLDDQGRLVEDWGTVEVLVTGTNVSATAKPVVQAIRLNEVIPAAQARAEYGPVQLTLTAYRAPTWPSGMDVLTVRLAETSGRETSVQLALNLPENVRIGAQTVSIGSRSVVGLPGNMKSAQAMRDWGWADDAVALPGWARPTGECDSAFHNIRAGMGGVPISYRFKVEPKANFKVVLGFCESHWAQTGQRPVICQVEGAKPQEVDPVARWGQHKPGGLLFAARDQNGDGILEVSVLPKPGAPDQNPILNAIWVFAPTTDIGLDQVIAGKLNGTALRYVDVGGPKDQSLYAGGKVEYAMKLPAKGAQELTFLVAARGGAVPTAGKTGWTPEKLRASAAQVWRDWHE